VIVLNLTEELGLNCN